MRTSSILSVPVYRKFILKQMQYRFAVDFGTLSSTCLSDILFITQTSKIRISDIAEYPAVYLFIFCKDTNTEGDEHHRHYDQVRTLNNIISFILLL